MLALAVLAREWHVHWYHPHRGRLYQRLDRPELAAAAWRAYLHTPTLLGARRKLQARYSLAHCYFRLDRLQDALDQADVVVAQTRDPALAGLAHQMRSDALARLDRSAEAEAARAAAGQALAQTGEAALFARELEVERRRRAGDWFGALACLEDLAETVFLNGPDDYALALRLRLAQMRLELGFHEAAMATAEALLGRAGLPIELQHDSHAAAARAYLALDQLNRADRDARAAFRMANLAGDRDKLIDDCLLLGEVALHQGDFVQAMHNFQRVRECGGRGRWLAALAEAQCLSLWGRDSEAAGAFALARRHLGETGDSSLALDLAEATVLLPRQPERVADLVRPHLDTAIDVPKRLVRRDALAMVAAQVDGSAESVRHRRALVDRHRRRFGHDRVLMAFLDEVDAEMAQLEGRYLAAVECCEHALRRPLPALLRPRYVLRRAELLELAGRQEAARAGYEDAAEGPIALGAVLTARQRLSI